MRPATPAYGVSFQLGNPDGTTDPGGENYDKTKHENKQNTTKNSNT